MPQSFWMESTAWWDTVPPEFAFLLGLPFAIAALALFGNAVRRRRDMLARALR